MIKHPLLFFCQLFLISSAHKYLNKDPSLNLSILTPLSILQIQKYVEAAEMVMDPVVECVRPLYPAKIWEDLR